MQKTKQKIIWNLLILKMSKQLEDKVNVETDEDMFAYDVNLKWLI